MCLDLTKIFRSKKKALANPPRAKVATKAMTVYKFMYRNNRLSVLSPYQRFVYLIGKLYEVRNFTYDIYNWGLANWRHEVHQGFHAYLKGANAVACKEWNTHVIVECTIPKGSRYHLGDDGDIVTNAMIIKRIVPESECNKWEKE